KEVTNLGAKLTWKSRRTMNSLHIIFSLVLTTDEDDVNREITEGPDQKTNHLCTLTPLLELWLIRSDIKTCSSYISSKKPVHNILLDLCKRIDDDRVIYSQFLHGA